ncbi:MAG: AraC family transcriptional regulator, partial [Methylovulum sp.]|nr:AraC family transcriptional regulator [Methylovulum sp.]
MASERSASAWVPPHHTVEGIKLSTATVAPHERQSWLREVICREYTHVDITSPGNHPLSQELGIYAWGNLQLSVIHSSAINIARPAQEPYLDSQDAYFAVVLTSGQYVLAQNGREVYLQPGDITIYDATKPHQIDCPKDFGKLIVTIPRRLFRERMAGIDNCTALHIPGVAGAGLIAGQFLRTLTGQIGCLTPHEFTTLADYTLDLLTLAIASVRPATYNLSSNRTAALNRLKALIE